MSTEPSREQQVDAALAAYFEAEAAGQAPDRGEFLGRHPELADELQSFFAGHDCILQCGHVPLGMGRGEDELQSCFAGHERILQCGHVPVGMGRGELDSFCTHTPLPVPHIPEDVGNGLQRKRHVQN